ncbi:actin binding protein [Reticulomyxa filosa]|uniref:Actin binding protein n=1 Tax=Reticulomyxa filosa TaxID=46433 RepID=X6N6W4_RETFI|nr:actin binding protein [Reticulomyxa filosa]|eukprot:ETO22010.1 actin binding protein [Reticulomyxa filosa]
MFHSNEFKTRFVVIECSSQTLRIYRDKHEFEKIPNSPRFEFDLNEHVIELYQFEKDREDFGMKMKLKKQGEHYFAFSSGEDRDKAAAILLNCNPSGSGGYKRKKAKLMFTFLVDPHILTTTTSDDRNVRNVEKQAQWWKTICRCLVLSFDFIYLRKKFLRQSHVVQLVYIQEIARILTMFAKSAVIKSSGSSSLVEDFVAASGITSLCTLAVRNVQDHRWLLGILDIVTVILDTQDIDGVNIGCGLLVEHSHAVQAITNMFENRNVEVRLKVTKLLTALMVYNDDGLSKVTGALHAYSDAHNNGSVFEEFVRGIYFETDLNFRCAALQLINAALGFMPEIDERVLARHNLSELGFDSILQEMMKRLHEVVKKLIAEGEISDDEEQDDQDQDKDKDKDKNNKDKEKDKQESNKNEDKKGDDETTDKEQPKKTLFADARIVKRLIRKVVENDDIIEPQYLLLAQQLQLYYDMKDEDDQQVIWNNTNLSDPEQAYHLLFKKALREKHLPDLTHILAGLLLIPKSKTYLWTIFEKIILLSTTGEMAVKLRAMCDEESPDDQNKTEEEKIQQFQEKSQLLQELQLIHEGGFPSFQLMKKWLSMAEEEVENDEVRLSKQEMENLRSQLDESKRELIKLRTQMNWTKLKHNTKTQLIET